MDGNRIHFYEGGPASTAGKPPVVLVHGLGSTAERWASLMMQFAAAGRRVYALDLLGYGESAKPKDASYSIPMEAGIVEGFLHAKGIGEYDLCGWSMGGWVALQVALDENRSHARRVRRLVLFNSAGLRYQLEWDPELFVPDTPAKLSALDQLVFTHSSKLPWFVKKDLSRQARREGWVIRRSLDSMLRGLDVEDGKLGELKMPVLIVWGKQDRIVPLSVGERMHAAMPQSVLDIYDGCGHLGPVLFAERIGPRVIEFLNVDPPEPPGVHEF